MVRDAWITVAVLLYQVPVFAIRILVVFPFCLWVIKEEKIVSVSTAANGLSIRNERQSHYFSIRRDEQ